MLSIGVACRVVAGVGAGRRCRLEVGRVWWDGGAADSDDEILTGDWNGDNIDTFAVRRLEPAT